MYWQGSIVGCFGALRSGKTMQAVIIARQHFDAGWLVASNIDLSFDHFRLRSLQQFDALCGSPERKIVILLDELQANLDSREFGNKLQIVMTRRVIMLGKRQSILLFTSPHINMVDVRVRQLITDSYHLEPVFDNHGDQLYGKMTNLKHTVGTDIAKQVSITSLAYSDHFGLYNTLDEDVFLGDIPGSEVDLPAPYRDRVLPLTQLRSGTKKNMPPLTPKKEDLSPVDNQGLTDPLLLALDQRKKNPRN